MGLIENEIHPVQASTTDPRTHYEARGLNHDGQSVELPVHAGPEDSPPLILSTSLLPKKLNKNFDSDRDRCQNPT